MMQLLVILAVLPSLILAARIQLVNISPEEAQQFITQQSLDLKYARKLGEYPLGMARDVIGGPERKFFFNGQPIDNPDDFNEEVFEASQFHGQDGLGRSMFGYTDHNQARLEARNANGEVRGSYQYIDPSGEEIQVQYWSDSLGFHQTDNRPQVILEPITDTPEVQEARAAHFKAWDEAARLAKAYPDSSDHYNHHNINAVDDEQEKEEEDDEIVGALSNQQQSLARYPSLPYSQHISPLTHTNGDLSVDAVIVEAAEESRKSLQYAKAAIQKRQNSEDENVAEDEVPSDPKGFFYSFEYPVSVVVENELKRSAIKKRSDEAEAAASEVKTNVAESPAPATTDDRVSLKSILTGETLVAAVHDTQVHPKQKLIHTEQS